MTDGLWDRSIRHFSARVLSQAHFRRLRHREHQRIVQAIVNRDADEVERSGATTSTSPGSRRSTISAPSQ